MQSTSRTTEAESKKQVKNVKATEMAIWLQKTLKGLQKLGRAEC